jgi:hypothetical protein
MSDKNLFVNLIKKSAGVPASASNCCGTTIQSAQGAASTCCGAEHSTQTSTCCGSQNSGKTGCCDSGCEGNAGSGCCGS